MPWRTAIGLASVRNRIFVCVIRIVNVLISVALHPWPSRPWDGYQCPLRFGPPRLERTFESYSTANGKLFLVSFSLALRRTPTTHARS